MYGQLKKVILFGRLEKGQSYHMMGLFMTLRLADIASLLKYLDLQIYSMTYVCPFFRQNGGNGLHQAEENLIPH
jgi:hypothetical protein